VKNKDNIAILPNSMVQTHTFCTMQVDKNIHGAFYNGIGDWITGLHTHF